MKKQNSKVAASYEFQKDYEEIVGNIPQRNQEWTGTGDAFVKFSLYVHQPTIAKPYTTLNRVPEKN